MIEIEQGFLFRGRIEVGSFLAFARHRAGRLDLGLSIGAAAPSAVALSVRGPEALVGAFEMAMSLGPSDCLVNDVVASAAVERPA